MPANECLPTYSPAETITAFATGAVTGKRFVKISGPRVGGGLIGGTSAVTTTGPGYGANTLSTDVYDILQVTQCSVSGEAALGVAGYDAAAASGDASVLKVYKRGAGHILPVTCGANITAGQELQTDASGRAIPLASGRALGYAVDSASSGADVEMVLY